MKLEAFLRLLIEVYERNKEEDDEPTATAEPTAEPAKSWAEFIEGLEDSDSLVHALLLIGRLEEYEQRGWTFEFKQDFIMAFRATGFNPYQDYDVALDLAENDKRLEAYRESLIKYLNDAKAKSLFEQYATELGLPSDELNKPKTFANTAKRFLALSRVAAENNIDSRFLHDAIKADLIKFSSGFVLRESVIEKLEELAHTLDIGAIIEQVKATRNSPTAININVHQDWLISQVWSKLAKFGKVSEDDFISLFSFRRSFLATFSASSNVGYLYGIAYLLNCCPSSEDARDYAGFLLETAKPVSSEELADWAAGASHDAYDYLYTFDGFFDKALPLKSDFDSVVQGV